MFLTIVQGVKDQPNQIIIYHSCELVIIFAKVSINQIS
jgi:hypothetical protein